MLDLKIFKMGVLNEKRCKNLNSLFSIYEKKLQKKKRRKGGRKRKTTKKRTGGASSDDEVTNPMWEQETVQNPTFTEEDVNKLINEANKKIPILMNDKLSSNLTSEDMKEIKNLITDLNAAKTAIETGTLILNDKDKNRLKGSLGYLTAWYSWRMNPVVRWRGGVRKTRKLYKKRKN
jgi:hypothetical protein